MAKNLYARVTATILAELEKGVVPWRRDWRSIAGSGIPHNAVSMRPYRGTNTILLWLRAQQQGWSSLGFLTYKQARDLGGTVKQGAKSGLIVFVKQLVVKDHDNENVTKLVPMLRAYSVFHTSQCDGLSEAILNPAAKSPRNPDARDPLIDAFTAATQADVREGQGEPVYHPGGDYISMPCFTDFTSADGFYSTLFHELTHWTAHKSRLDRNLKSRFGDLHAYSAEELCAELGASFLCAEFGLDNGKLQHAAYLQGWITLLKHDARAFFTAANRAQEASDYLRRLALADQPVAA